MAAGEPAEDSGNPDVDRLISEASDALKLGTAEPSPGPASDVLDGHDQPDDDDAATPDPVSTIVDRHLLDERESAGAHDGADQASATSRPSQRAPKPRKSILFDEDREQLSLIVEGGQRQPDKGESLLDMDEKSLQVLTDAELITLDLDVSGFDRQELALLAGQGALLNDATGYHNYDCDPVLNAVYR